MAFYAMIWTFLALFLDLTCYGSRERQEPLKFILVPPDNVTFVRGDDKEICCPGLERTRREFDFSILSCQVNKKANITWQACHPFNRNVMSREHFLPCDELFQNESKYCLDRNNKRVKRSTEMASTSIKQLIGGKDWEPHTGCIRCIAQAGKEKIQAFGRYTYQDPCCTPTRYEAIGPQKVCLRKSNIYCNSTEHQCRVESPHGVRVVQNLTADGEEADLILQWEHKRSINYVANVYGYRITFIDDIGDHHCNRIITKYNKTRWFRDGKYYFSVRDHLNVQFGRNKRHFSYKFTLQALPKSKTITVSEKLTYSELCENYNRIYGHIPTKCLMVTDIKQLPCISPTSVTLTWNSTILPSSVSKIEVWHYSKNRRPRGYELLLNDTKVTIGNVTENSIALIRLKVGNKVTYTSRDIQLRCDSLESSPRKKLNITQIGLFVFLSLSILIIIVVLIVYRIDKCSIYPLKIEYHNQLVTQTSPNDENEKDIKVMIVYPEGCEVVEKLILYLGSLLHDLGIKVLVDLYENQRAAVEGKVQKLVTDFNTATYVVVLCMRDESNEGDGVKSSGNYGFVMNSLLLPACTEADAKRFIGVPLSRQKNANSVPRFLRQRSYELSSDLEFFLQHVLHGIQTTCSTSIFRKACRDQLPNIDEIKKRFRDMLKSIDADTHQNCYPRYCNKGTLYSSEESLNSNNLKDSGIICGSIEVPSEELIT